MPKGTNAADDMAVRLDWPQPASPFADTNHAHVDPTAGVTERASGDLELVLKRLDVISHQLKVLTETVESLRTAGTDTSPKENGEPTAAKSRSPRRATARRQPAT